MAKRMQIDILNKESRRVRKLQYADRHARPPLADGPGLGLARLRVAEDDGGRICGDDGGRDEESPSLGSQLE